MKWKGVTECMLTDLSVVAVSDADFLRRLGFTPQSIHRKKLNYLLSLYGICPDYKKSRSVDKTKRCECCDTLFVPSKPSGRFCSSTCSNKSRVRSKKTNAKISKSLKAYNGTVIRSNVRITKHCPICNDTFTVIPSRSHRKYCSRSCCNKDTRFEFKHKPPGGYREGSGRSKNGYYNGIFMASTYELAFYVWNIDNNIDIKRCDFNIPYNDTTYVPDFIIDGNIYEIKGYHTPIVDVKTKAAKRAGYTINVLYLNDIRHMIKYCKSTYGVNDLCELYDDISTYTHVCDNCKSDFIRSKPIKTAHKFCCRSCSGQFRTKSKSTSVSS